MDRGFVWGDCGLGDAAPQHGEEGDDRVQSAEALQRLVGPTPFVMLRSAPLARVSKHAIPQPLARDAKCEIAA